MLRMWFELYNPDLNGSFKVFFGKTSEKGEVRNFEANSVQHGEVSVAVALLYSAFYSIKNFRKHF